MSCDNCIHRELCNVHGYIDADECACYKNKADYVEVVRCKDCEKYDGHRYCVYFCETVLDDDFCSYGERK